MISSQFIKPLVAQMSNFDFAIAKNEMKWFIQKVKNDNLDEDNPRVFIAFIDVGIESPSLYVITHGYIENEFMLDFIHDFEYYISDAESITIVGFAKHFNNDNLLLNESLRKIRNWQILRKYIESDFVSLGIKEGAISFIYKDTVKRRYFEDSDSIPDIYKIIEQNGVPVIMDSIQMSEEFKN